MNHCCLLVSGSTIITYNLLDRTKYSQVAEKLLFWRRFTRVPLSCTEEPQRNMATWQETLALISSVMSHVTCHVHATRVAVTPLDAGCSARDMSRSPRDAVTRAPRVSWAGEQQPLSLTHSVLLYLTWLNMYTRFMLYACVLYSHHFQSLRVLFAFFFDPLLLGTMFLSHSVTAFTCSSNDPNLALK